MDDRYKLSFVSLRTAKMLKAVGFDWPTVFIYDDNGRIVPGNIFVTKKVKDEELAAPTLAVAQRWLREVKHRWASVECEYAHGLQRHEPDIKYLAELYDNVWGYFYLQDWDDNKKRACKVEFDTYEEALDAAIYECLIINDI